LPPVQAPISAKHSEANAKEQNPGSRSTLTFDRKKKVRKRGMLREKITVHRFRGSEFKGSEI